MSKKAGSSLARARKHSNANMVKTSFFKICGDGLHRVEDAERMVRKLDAQADKHVQVAGEFLGESQDAFQIKHGGSSFPKKIAARAFAGDKHGRHVFI